MGEVIKVLDNLPKGDLNSFWISKRETLIVPPPSPIIELPVFEGYKD